MYGSMYVSKFHLNIVFSHHICGVYGVFLHQLREYCLNFITLAQ